jgi:hypothetical protein
LWAEKKDEAILYSSEYGPHFCDIRVWDNCNANIYNFTQNFGSIYANDTGMVGKTFFTGSGDFQVKEIEVFEASAIDCAVRISDTSSAHTPAGDFSVWVEFRDRS